MSNSNCFFGAVAIKRRLGGRLKWRSGWHKGGWQGFLDSPWGHFQVQLGNTLLSYNPDKESLSAWRQLWFQGHIKRRRAKNESR